MTKSQSQQFSWQELGKILAGFFCIWFVFDRTALTHSTLGERGILISIIVITTTFGVEKLIFKQTVLDALRSLGLGCPNLRTMLIVIFICMILLAFYPAFSLATGTKLTLHDHWVGMSLGLFAQAGMAEEVLFRGYLFGHLRRGRTFWHAARLSLLPFVAVHVLLGLDNRSGFNAFSCGNDIPTLLSLRSQSPHHLGISTPPLDHARCNQAGDNS